MTSAPLIEFQNVERHFAGPRMMSWTTRPPIRAVDGVSFALTEGRTLGLVGESGCGKSTIARVLLSLQRPTAGAVYFRGKDVTQLTLTERRAYRQTVQAVFQDPWSSLNPRARVSEIILEPVLVSKKLSRSERRHRVEELLSLVGLEPAAANSFPHEFSGGQRQRIAIARALALEPKLIVFDEPVSALDVSIRAQLMNLLKDMQDSLSMTYLLIAHDFATVEYLSSDAAVMYLGVIVEEANASELFSDPLHPYSQALISAARPEQTGPEDRPLILQGDVPSADNIPTGCRFRTRCPFAFERCANEEPVLREVRSRRRVACHLY